MGSVKLTVHLFSTEAEALVAIESINTGEGYNVLGRITNTYTRYYPTEDGNFYIQADPVTRKYLHEETDIEITVPDN